MPCPAECCSLRLAVVGSFPKPASLRREKAIDWFQAGGAEGRDPRYAAPEDDVAGMFDEAEFAAALRAVLARQSMLDVVTDGEIRRDNYIYGFMRKLDGVDFSSSGRTATSVRQGAYVAELPTIVAPLRPRSGVRRLAETEWLPAQRSSDATVHLPVKFALPGPLTCSDTIADKYYVPTYGAEGGRAKLVADLAPLLRAEVDALVAAGCKHIQIDEPVIARYPHLADTVLPIVDDIVAGAAAAGCTTYVHMCCGYPDKLDSKSYPKADRRSYVELAPRIEALCPSVNVVSIEDAHRHNDLAELLPLFKTKTVMLGVVHSSSSRVETAGEIERRAAEALRFLPPERLILAPDCGLGMLPERVLDAKLGALAAAASALRGDAPATPGTPSSEAVSVSDSGSGYPADTGRATP